MSRNPGIPRGPTVHITALSGSQLAIKGIPWKFILLVAEQSSSGIEGIRKSPLLSKSKSSCHNTKSRGFVSLAYYYKRDMAIRKGPWWHFPLGGP